MKIALGGDHVGFEFKSDLVESLRGQGHDVKDFGTYTDESVDYPDYVHPVAEAVEVGLYDFGLLICGSGNGVAMTANKHSGIRAALCWTSELAALARQHNNANILCMPARFISHESALEIAEMFLSSKFEGGRHERRVKKISC
ncbi:MAG: ribose 5-phosphate isomerase B [Bacteroidetes bacterium]|nr:ribose 5-phosphate isomerase B [Bacteroidota bacterium]